MIEDSNEGIIILGHPRSGTTLLRRLLDNHSQIACPGETHILSAGARFLQSQTTGDGVDMGVLAGLSFAGFDDQDVISRLREFIFTFPREHARRMGKNRWAEKTAFDAYFIPEIEQFCGDNAKFVGVIRHGLDVALSCSHFVEAAGTVPHVMHSYIQRYEMPLEAFVRSWRDVTTELIAFADRHPDNCLLFRYEDLLDDPEEVLTGILEFVGEKYEAQILDTDLRISAQAGFGDHKSYQNSGINSENISRWRSLSPWMISMLAEIANPLLDQCGYELVETDSDPKDVKAARRRYELSLMLHSTRDKT